MDWQGRSMPAGKPQPKPKRRHETEFYTMAPRATESVAWPDFARTVETGDIALFSGPSLISWAIKLGELGSSWSHIGMFVREDDGRVRIWESTNADGQVDTITGKAKGGVRLVDAETAIRKYLASGEHAMVVARRLYIDESALGEPKLVDPVGRLPKLRKFMRRVAKLPYEQNPLELVRAADIARMLELVYAWRSKSSYFCSELVACSYIQLGLLPDDTETSRHAGLYTPMDFAQESEDLPFLFDRNTDESLVALGPHLEIVFPDDGGDPMRKPPRRMTRPSRPQLRLDRGIEDAGRRYRW